jgi:hypothetical protein
MADGSIGSAGAVLQVSTRQGGRRAGSAGNPCATRGKRRLQRGTGRAFRLWDFQSVQGHLDLSLGLPMEMRNEVRQTLTSAIPWLVKREEGWVLEFGIRAMQARPHAAKVQRLRNLCAML